ncbi:putative Phosphatidylglycerol/phosphatidylinositol transfer protein [Cladochytrium replicatum]|nr:putative Phosphatidylglycerol/phosphatidylinositol transfer protein [Cladochytrium replicatum]
MPNSKSLLVLLVVLAVASFASADKQISFSNLWRSISDRIPKLTAAKDPVSYSPCVPDEEALFILDALNLNPDPPVRGQQLSFEVRGTVKREVVNGTYVDIKVKYGIIQLYSGRLDFCEQMATLGEECPFKEGEVVVAKSADIPGWVFPGTYTIHSEAYTPDGTLITCLDGVVKL